MDDPNLQLLYWLPIWVLALLFFLGLLLAAAGGRLFGARVRAKQEPQAGSLVGTMLAAVLGLLGLLLAFTYSIATVRAEQRKQAVVVEANALGTAYLRAGLLAEPARTQLQSLLRQYADTRILSHTAQGPTQIRAAIAESERIQARIWPTAARNMAGRPPNLVDSLLLSSLNAVIDMHTTRLAAGRDRLPEVIILLLFAVSAIALWLTGYQMALIGRPHLALTTTLAVLTTLIVLVVLDLDRPRGGFVLVSQQPLIEARWAMQDDTPIPPATNTALPPQPTNHHTPP